MEIFKSGVDLLQLGVTAMGGGAGWLYSPYVIAECDR